MKCLLCLKCGDLVQMKSKEIKACGCGNVRGRYKPDGMTLEVKIESIMDARVVGISNDFLRQGKIPLSDPSYNGTLFRHYDSFIIIIYPFTTGDVVVLKE